MSGHLGLEIWLGLANSGVVDPEQRRVNCKHTLADCKQSTPKKAPLRDVAALLSNQDHCCNVCNTR